MALESHRTDSFKGETMLSKKEIIQENEYLKRKVEYYEKRIILFDYLSRDNFFNELDYLIACKDMMDRAFSEMSVFMKIEKQQHFAQLELEKAERLVDYKTKKAAKEAGYEFIGISDS